MQKPPLKEADFFEALQRETPVEISVRTSALALANIHSEICEIEATGRIPDGESDSPARHFRPACAKLCDFFTEFRDFKNAIIKLGPDELPDRILSKLGPAFNWVMKDVRRYLDCLRKGKDPTLELCIAFDEFQAVCTPSTRSESIVNQNFEDRVNEIYGKIVDAALHVAKSIENEEERRAAERDLALNRTRQCHRLPKGKGFSHFGDLGAEYKGIKVVDETHLSLYGTVLEVTSQVNWNKLDGWLKAHFADEPFAVTTKDLEKFGTPDEKKLRSFIHQETLEEAGRRRVRNCRYTGRGWFLPPTQAANPVKGSATGW